MYARSKTAYTTMVEKPDAVDPQAQSHDQDPSGAKARSWPTHCEDLNQTLSEKDLAS